MSHDDFAFEPVRGLPAALPPGESLLWQSSPRWRSLAVHVFHVRKVALYFAALVACRIGYGLANGHSWSAMLLSCGVLIALGCAAVGVLSLLAYLHAAATVYSITSRRVLLRHGVAVPITMNIPFALIDAAQLKEYADGSGDIALGLAPGHRVGYLVTWPHLRSGHLTRPQPSFRALRDAREAAGILGTALAADAGAGVGAGVVADMAARVESGIPRAAMAAARRRTAAA